MTALLRGPLHHIVRGTLPVYAAHNI